MDKTLVKLNKIVEDYSSSKAEDTRLLVIETSRNIVESKIRSFVEKLSIKTYTIESNFICPGTENFTPIVKTLIPYCSNNYIIPKNVVKYNYVNIVLNNGNILFYDFYTIK